MDLSPGEASSLRYCSVFEAAGLIWLEIFRTYHPDHSEWFF